MTTVDLMVRYAKKVLDNPTLYGDRTVAEAMCALGMVATAFPNTEVVPEPS